MSAERECLYSSTDRFEGGVSRELAAVGGSCRSRREKIRRKKPTSRRQNVSATPTAAAIAEARGMYVSGPK
jgi:hypothetical protein